MPFSRRPELPSLQPLAVGAGSHTSAPLALQQRSTAGGVAPSTGSASSAASPTVRFFVTCQRESERRCSRCESPLCAVTATDDGPQPSADTSR
jgi:hypothetical protein